LPIVVYLSIKYNPPLSGLIAQRLSGLRSHIDDRKTPVTHNRIIERLDTSIIRATITDRVENVSKIFPAVSFGRIVKDSSDESTHNFTFQLMGNSNAIDGHL